MRLFFSTIVAVILTGSVFCQHKQINGLVNEYYKITSLTASYAQMQAGSDLSGLQRGDKVVLMQMTGWAPTWRGIRDVHDPDGFLNAGTYEMLAVASVNDALDRVYFTVSLETTKYTAGEKFQLIKMYEADYAEVTDTLKAKDWDGETGGVIALVIYNELVLQADIDAARKGFRGGMPDPDYPGICRDWLFGVDTFYFLNTQTGRAGERGEGGVTITQTPYTNNYTRGPGQMVLGGGGGLGWFAGGAGGGHIGAGGNGGYQKDGCSIDIYSNGGIGVKTLNYYGYDQVMMGGGGGSSTSDALYSATKGGDGGGIILILADTIIGNNHALRAGGGSVTGIAEAGGGGGGAGGAILLDVNTYVTNLIASVKGGNGGNTGSQNSGAGGGGGGGIVWYAGSTLSPRVIPDIGSGANGESQSSDFLRDGSYGIAGQTLSQLELPLNGFLFNSLQGTDTLCQGQTPLPIVGSSPKGGNGVYAFTWLQSTDGSTWSVIGGEVSKSYAPPSLNQTTYFTRVVESDGISDTALSVEIFVYDAISGNNLAIRDTFCYNDSPGVLATGVLSGGSGVYDHTWYSSTDQITWTSRGSSANLAEGNLTQTTYYYRYVESGNGVCTDTSNVDTLTILPSITGNNLLRSDTAICTGLDGGEIRVNSVSGGDGVYRYAWYTSPDNVSYSVISGAVSDSYSPGILSNTAYYRREVASGADDACLDMSSTYTLTVYPSIGNNILTIDPDLYCYGDQPNLVDGSTPGGGDNSAYTFVWQERIPAESWNTLAGETGEDYSPSGAYYETIEVRRVVKSGDFDACIDTSGMQTIEIVPQIFNPVTTDDENICNGATPLAFLEGPATGGSGTISYLWEAQVDGETTWNPASASPNDQEDYSSDALTQTTRFRRVATSEVCDEVSDPIVITVYPSISSNEIEGGSPQYTCYNTAIDLAGISGLSGGRPGDLRFLWEESAEGSGWSAAAGESSSETYQSPALTDTLYYRRIVFSGETDQCVDTTEAVLVRINSLPEGDIISDAFTSCADETVPVAFENLLGNGPFSIGLGVDEVTTTEQGISASSGTIGFVAVETGLVKVLNITDVNGCEADLSSNTGEIDLRVYAWPDANPGSDLEVCGETATLDAVLSGEGGLWSGTGEFSNPAEPDAEVTIDPFSGSITEVYQWKEWNWQCMDSNTIEVTFYEQPEELDPMEDVKLDYTFEHQLDARLSVGEGLWEQISAPPAGSATFDNNTLSNTTVYFADYVTGDYLLRWSVTNGEGICPVVSSDLLVSIGQIETYTGFSPNDDGINDYYIINLSGNNEAELKIFDRWGALVITLSDPDQISWDGKNEDGQEVPEGTYYFILHQIGVPVDDISGYFELRR
ncbi:MAG: gliding motility-associated C-terminal domain-containing protein [Bacteroidales bacterium]|nr:gliding motility-associated C-terminal domain-containing protein [Bacteroidales bacterium]